MSIEKITIVGPFSPYRGGIATHTTRLFTELGTTVNVDAEAYRNPFPKWLYPGKHQGDLNMHPDCIPNIHYDLSYHLPGAWGRVASRIIQNKTDAVIIPWWTFFFAPHYGYLCKRLRRHKIPIIFLCHNLFDHESARWKKWLSLKALGQGTAFIFHSAEEQALARRHFPSKASLLFPHPIYDQFFQRDVSSSDTSTIQLLCFGLVRPYKGLDTLITALETYPIKAHLTVAGEWWNGQTDLYKRCKVLEQQGRLTLIDHYITDEVAEQLFAESHCVILPYKKATNSGVLAHAIHMGKPAIATQTGAFPQCINSEKTGLLVPPDDPAKLTKAIQQIQTMYAEGHDFTPAIESMASIMSWDAFADDISEFIPKIRINL